MTLIRYDSMAWYPWDKELASQYTFTSRFDEKVKLYVRDVVQDLIGVPRGAVPSPGYGRDFRSEGTMAAFHMVNPPRNETQRQKINESIALFVQDKDHIFRATTGFGKTYCALSIAQAVGVNVLVVVTKDDLMAQWRNAILTHTDIPEERIGTIQQDVCDYEGKTITLAMVHSLAKDKYGPEVKEAFGLVVFDEVHRMAAETFSTVCQMFTAKHRLGLSATPERIDGKDPVFIMNIGPVMVATELVTMPPQVYMVNTGWKPLRRIWYTIGKMMPLYVALAESQERNALIVKYVYQAWAKGRRIIVFSDLKGQHLHKLSALAVEIGIPQDDMAFYVGGMTEKAREKAKAKKVLWATYSMAAEATDIPWLDVAVLATPRANVAQPVGRVLREWEGKPTPIVVDLVDSAPEELQGFAGRRRKIYKSLGGVVKTINPV